MKDLESNINTLREKGLTATEAMSGNIKEMAQELIDNNVTKELPDRINACVDSACVDKEIEGLSDELIITEEEATEIKAKEQSNPESNSTSPEATPTPIAGAEVQYGQWVKPSQSVCKNSGGEYNKYGNNNCWVNRENSKTICSTSGDELPTIETLRAVVTDCGGDPFDDSENDRNNESYQACYKKIGFTSSYTCWSSTVRADSNTWSWTMHFGGGYHIGIHENSNSYVRCIRDEQ